MLVWFFYVLKNKMDHIIQANLSCKSTRDSIVSWTWCKWIALTQHVSIYSSFKVCPFFFYWVNKSIILAMKSQPRLGQINLIQKLFWFLTKTRSNSWLTLIIKLIVQLGFKNRWPNTILQFSGFMKLQSYAICIGIILSLNLINDN
jgi:hypothetical protein